MSPVSSSAWIFSSSVLPTPLISVTRPSRDSADDRHRGLAHRLGRGAVGDHAVGDGAVELVEVPELVEGGGDLCVREVGHRGALAYGAGARSRLAHPPDLRRGRDARGRRRRGAGGARRRGPPPARGRRRLARRHRRARRAAAAPTVLHRPAQARARERLRRRLRARARGGRRARLPARRRRLPRPGRAPRHARARPRRADLVLGSRYVPGRRDRRLDRAAARGLARRLRLRARRAARAGARPHRRDEGLARAARCARSSPPRCARRATRSRSS